MFQQTGRTVFHLWWFKFYWPGSSQVPALQTLFSLLVLSQSLTINCFKGSVWVLSIQKRVSHKSTCENYCNQVLYLVVFSIICVSLSIVGLFVFCFCCIFCKVLAEGIVKYLANMYQQVPKKSGGDETQICEV